MLPFCLRCWWDLVRKSRTHAAAKTFQLPRFRLVLEQLETRLTPGTIQWANNVSGDFNDGTNWVGGVVPGASDDAVIDFSGVTVTSSANVTIKSLTCTGQLSIGGGTFSLQNATIGSSVATLSVPTGTVDSSSGQSISVG